MGMASTTLSMFAMPAFSCPVTKIGLFKGIDWVLNLFLIIISLIFIKKLKIYMIINFKAYKIN
jgi:hypothetical protein